MKKTILLLALLIQAPSAFATITCATYLLTGPGGTQWCATCSSGPGTPSANYCTGAAKGTDEVLKQMAINGATALLNGGGGTTGSR